MKLRASVYRKAAELLFESAENYACVAISRQSKYRTSSEEIMFQKLFKPDNLPPFQVGYFDSAYGSRSSENREARITALLLMAEIAEAGDYA